MNKSFPLIFLISISLSAQELPKELEMLAGSLTSKEIEMLKQSSTSNFPDKEDKQEQTDTLVENDFKVSTIPLADDKFGYNFFKTIPTSTSAASDMPITPDYIISVGDEVSLILSGTRDEIYNLEVNLDGTILIPELGSILLAGESFKDAKEKINRLVIQSFVGVRVDTTMSELSAKKITIVGAVNTPGTYLVNPFTTITSALAYSGGVSEFASLRSIVLKRANGDEIIFDLYDLLINGDRKSDVALQTGDTILLQGTDKFVEISGEVLRPMTYEYKSSDTYSDLLDFALGLTIHANKQQYTAVEKDQQNIVTREFSLDESVSDRNLLSIYINRDFQQVASVIKVRGEAVRERVFDSKDYQTLSQVINEITFSNNIFPYYGLVIQEFNKGLSRESLTFSLADPATYENISLKGSTEIFFFSREDLDENQDFFREQILLSSDQVDFSIDVQSIEQQGNALNSYDEEDNVIIVNSADLKLISFGNEVFIAPLVGRFTPEALFNFFGKDIKLNETDVTVSGTRGVYSNSYKDIFSSSDTSQITFPEKGFYTFEVEINGQVANPGKYIVNNSISLNDLYSIAGGLNERASTKSILLSRKSLIKKEREAVQAARKTILDVFISQIGNASVSNTSLDVASILPILQMSENIEFSGRLTGNLSPDSESAKNIFLVPGDKITVSPISNTISVIGEVLKPIATVFSADMTYQDYIQVAGKTTEYADMKNIYVIKSDGTSIPLESTLFNKPLYPEPGDTIVVPRNLSKIDTIPLISVATKIISDIAFSAASLNALNRN